MKQGIGMAYLSKVLEEGYRDFIRIRNKDLKAEIVDLPIYKIVKDEVLIHLFYFVIFKPI